MNGKLTRNAAISHEVVSKPRLLFHCLTKSSADQSHSGVAMSPILSPDPTDLIARARADLRMGLPVVIGQTMVFAAETFAATALEHIALSEACFVVTARRAETLNMPVYDRDLTRVRLPADAGAGWIYAMANPARDLATPMKGPFNYVRDGDAQPHRLALMLLKSARLLPAAICVPAQHYENLTVLQPAWLEQARDARPVYTCVSRARVPLRHSENAKLSVFRPQDGGEEHYVIEIGPGHREEPVLCRLHSACFTGDLLGSLKCDCGPQLNAALQQMGQEDSGVLLYLNQEGRGIGLANKMRAYDLQDQGFDTVDANHRLGFEDDERDFRIGAALLKQVGVDHIRLMTNNPGKIDRMRDEGITVTERVPLKVGHTQHNTHYLRTKAERSGHML